MRRFVAPSIVVAAAWVCAVVSGTAAVAAAAPEACSLLRSKEIAAALAQPTSKAAVSSLPTVCSWKLAPTDTLPMAAVHTLVERGSTARASYKLASDFHADDRERLTGLGKKAFYAPSLGTVWVLEDRSTLFYVQGLYPTGAEIDAASMRSALVGLAGRAAKRF